MGDLYGIGNTLNGAQNLAPGLGVRLDLLNQARVAFESAGYIDRQAVVLSNLGNVYSQLGLFRRSGRLHVLARAIRCRLGVPVSIADSTNAIASNEVMSGNLARAEPLLEEVARVLAETENLPMRSDMMYSRGLIALLHCDAKAAIGYFRQRLKIWLALGDNNFVADTLSRLARSYLMLGRPKEALTASRRATRLMRQFNVIESDLAHVWTSHGDALVANGERAAADDAYESAYRMLCEGIATLGDEGVRRNFLNKDPDHRQAIETWVRIARRRRLAPTRWQLHLTGETDLRLPFQRLVDTGVRLNEMRSTGDLHDFLIDEATELSGAERLLLVLEHQDGLQLVGSQMPRGEDAAALLAKVTPLLAQVGRTRMTMLAHAPADRAAFEQRSQVVAPLVVQQVLLGYLYADIDGLFGRFHESDRDLLGMLASQAAVALANAQWAQSLEQKVEQRTEELKNANADTEQRAAELALINSIQQGMAAELNFQSIVDLVGDKLREVFRTGDIGIRWQDTGTGFVHYLYEYEHGKRLTLEPHAVSATGPWMKMVESRQPFVVDTLTEMSKSFPSPIPGTDQGKSMVMVPILAGDRVLGTILLENYEREYAFGESEVRLLSTVASSMGVALQNARLFDETQRLLKQTEQRNAELAVINSIQQGVASELDFRAIIDLVGDKLRAVLKTDEIGIRWYEHDSRTVHHLYEIEHGKRLAFAPVTYDAERWSRVVERREPRVTNTAAESSRIGAMPGTDTSKSNVIVPIIANDRVLGSIIIEDFEREYAFGEPEVRLVSTVA
ncbi:MAG: GAF domain-containing protein, partial [Casimicrobiaceae bacterium]